MASFDLFPTDDDSLDGSLFLPATCCESVVNSELREHPGQSDGVRNAERAGIRTKLDGVNKTAFFMSRCTQKNQHPGREQQSLL